MILTGEVFKCLITYLKELNKCNILLYWTLREWPIFSVPELHICLEGCHPTLNAPLERHHCVLWGHLNTVRTDGERHTHTRNLNSQNTPKQWEHINYMCVKLSLFVSKATNKAKQTKLQGIRGPHMTFVPTWASCRTFEHMKKLCQFRRYIIKQNYTAWRV